MTDELLRALAGLAGDGPAADAIRLALALAGAASSCRRAQRRARLAIMLCRAARERLRRREEDDRGHPTPRHPDRHP